MQHDDSLQQQLDALREEMAAMAAFYERQCVQRVGERLHQKLQQRHQSHWRSKAKRFQSWVCRWSSRILIGMSRAFIWIGQFFMKVGHRLDPDKHGEEDLTQQETPIIDSAYQVVEPASSPARSHKHRHYQRSSSNPPRTGEAE